MNSVQARDKIYLSMDSIALELDTLEGLIQIRNQTNFCIKSIVKSINKGKELNTKLENFTKHAA